MVSATSDQATGPETGSITSGKFTLRYRVEGTGIPAIVIGFPVYYSRVFSRSLRSHLRLVFLDHRGSAPSPGPVDDAEFALATLIDDIELARRTLELGRVVVIGHSGHSFLALEYAKRYPKHTSHVVMIGVGPDFSTASAEATEQSWQSSASPDRKAAMEESLRRIPDEELARLPPGPRFIKRYVRNGPRTWCDPRFDASTLWEGVEINVDMVGYVWGELFRDIDITRGLHSLELPVFLALGRHDFLVPPPSVWDPLASEFRDLTVRVFEKSGHTPQYEEPALFDAELVRWLGTHR